MKKSKNPISSATSHYLNLISGNSREEAQLPVVNLVANESDDGNDTIVLTGVFDEFFFDTSSRFRDAVNECATDEVDILLNTPGGDVFSAVAMASIVNGSDKTFNVHIEALAASAGAFFLFLAELGTVTMAKGGRIMVHNPWTFAMGDHHDFRSTADVLEGIQSDIVDALVESSDLDREDALLAVDDETWFNVKDAEEIGLIDSVQGKASAKNQWTLTMYDQVPKDLTEPPSSNKLKDAIAARERRLALLRVNQLPGE